MSTKQAKQRRRAGAEPGVPRPKAPAAGRALPSWVLPVVVLLIAFGVIALALVAKQSPGR